MQRYSFFVNHQNFCREKLKIYARFNSCLQLNAALWTHTLYYYRRERLFLRTATRGCTQQESTTDRGQQRKILQEKESVKCKKGGLEPQKQRFGCTKVKVWQHESKGLAQRNINKNHPHRSIRASASVDTSIRVGRYEHPRRSVRMSASVGADVCVGRCEHPRRSMRMTKVGIMKKKRDGVKREKKSMKRKKEGCKRGERGVRGYGRDAIPS